MVPVGGSAGWAIAQGATNSTQGATNSTQGATNNAQGGGGGISSLPSAAGPLSSGAFNSAIPHISARLEAETLSPAAGGRVTLAFVMEPEKGWHGYWANPGDAGKAMELEWGLPKGMVAGELRYPVPYGLLVAGLMNHVYKGRYALLTDLDIPVGLPVGTKLPVRVKAQWLACSDTVCVPEQADLALDLVVGHPDTQQDNASFDEYRRMLPRPLGGTAHFQATEAGGLRIAIPVPAGAKLSDLHFFPLTQGMKNHAAPQIIRRSGDSVVVELPDFALPANKTIEGVLRIGPEQGIAIGAQAGDVAPIDGANLAAGVDGAEEGSEKGLFSADLSRSLSEKIAAGEVSLIRVALLSFLGALLGGLILNIMPCVFPILSLKAMSLLRSGAAAQTKDGNKRARREAWAYAAGVILSCVALGGIVLGLRAGGESVGWAFQLQSPAVIVVLLALSLAIAMNLAGLFALSPVSVDGTLATKQGLAGDFWSGVLVAFVATPCTGPFMATALGTAFLLPPLAALAIFAGLGVGLALPFLLLAYIPALRAKMPRPGLWMERVQRWLAVPMALTALGLLWLLYRQAGAMGLAIGVAVALVIGGILVLLGRRQRADTAANGVQGELALICAGLLAVAVGAAVLGPMARSSDHANLSGMAWSEAALATARGGDMPVFLYFTADWCLSCKVNEAAAIDRAEVQSAFEKAGVQVMVGDWTRGDPDITRFLEEHGRSGVPLYLWYPAGGGEPKELPQILTPDMLRGLAEASATNEVEASATNKAEASAPNEKG
ncbi:MAG: thiol:disulfide interchange protein [Sphingobium sp.]|nr:thiol:disulfide interchange protein [Sphingobium sp.]